MDGRSEQSQPTIVTQQPGVAVTNPFIGGYVGSRGNARIVAYVDMIISILAFILVSLWMGLVSEEYNQLKNIGHEVNSSLYCVAMLFGGGILIFYAIEVWLAWELLLATRRRTYRPEAARKTRCWLYYNIFLIVVTLVHAGLSVAAGGKIGGTNFLWFIIRIVFVFIVHRFWQELERGLMVPNLQVSHVRVPVAVPAENNVNVSHEGQPQQFEPLPQVHQLQPTVQVISAVPTSTTMIATKNAKPLI